MDTTTQVHLLSAWNWRRSVRASSRGLRVRIIRSWPEVVPEDRNYVVDDLPRWLMRDCSYRGLDRLVDDVLVVEWDIAVDHEQLKLFAEQARSLPGEVLAAPYRIWDRGYPVWAQRHWDGAGIDTNQPHTAKPIETGDETCQLPSLGLTYLPKAFIDTYAASPRASHWGDVEMGMAWCAAGHWRSRVTWDVRPVHLHQPPVIVD